MPAAVPASSPRSRSRRPATRWLSWDLSPEAWIACAVTAVAALLRFSTLGHQSFWVDEASTVHEVSLSFGQMLHAVSHFEATPPLYFACAWVWTRIFSPGEVGIRSLSAVLGTATIPVVYLCGRELISRWAGVIAAALTAISPFMIWYSQEARAYMMLAFFCGLSLLFTARSQRTGSRSDLAWWAVLSAAALATHFFAVLLVFPEGVWLAWRLRSRAAGVAVGVVVVVEAALLPLLISDASHPLDDWIGGLSLHERLQGIPVDFGASQIYTGPDLRYGFWGAGVAVALILALVWFSAAGRRRGLALPGGLATFIIGLPVLGAVVGVDYLFSRNLTPAWIPLIVVIAGAAGAERARPLGIVLVAAVAVLFVWADVKISSNPSLQRQDWRGVAQTLGPARVPRVILIYNGDIGEEPLSIYLPGTTFSYSGVPASGPRLALAEIDVVGTVADNVARRLPAGVRLISSTYVDSIFVARFALTQPRDLTPAGAAAMFAPSSSSATGALVTPVSTTLSALAQR